MRSEKVSKDKHMSDIELIRLYADRVQTTRNLFSPAGKRLRQLCERAGITVSLEEVIDGQQDSERNLA